MRPYLEKPITKKKAGVAQVEESLPCQREALSSNPSTKKEGKGKRERERDGKEGGRERSS
jgi:hypothetical protein